MRTFAIVMLMASAVAPLAAAELAEDARTKLTTGLETLGPDTQAEQARELIPLLVDEAAVDSDWRTFFSEYFEDRPFLPALARFFEGALAETQGAEQVRLGRVTGIAAAAALGEHIEDLVRQADEGRYEAAVLALAWLSELVPALDPETAAAVMEALRSSLTGKSPALVPVSGSPPLPTPEMAWLGAQVGLVLRDYAVRGGQGPALASVLNLRGAGLRFWQSWGVLLLDNGGLDAAQLESLALLYAAIPMNLHSIGALVVPETTGIGPAAPELRLHSGQIVFIPNIPMGRLTWAREFGPGTGQPVGAEFTVAAGQQIVRAIQAVQLEARPELVVRRTAILANAGARPVAYLRQAVAPEVYLDDPNELLPSLAYQWFVSSTAMFGTAQYLFELGEESALDQFLLMADLMSGGGGQTPLFVTGPDGSVARATAPVSRIVLPPLGTPLHTITPGQPWATYRPGTPYLTGVMLGGTRWEFEIGPRGIVSRQHRWLAE